MRTSVDSYMVHKFEAWATIRYVNNLGRCQPGMSILRVLAALAGGSCSRRLTLQSLAWEGLQL
jgi:hypothetical protein